MKTLYHTSIFSQLAIYQDKLSIHPLFKEELSSEIIKEFSLYQYSDSILWVPMLSLMKSKVVQSKRFARAIEENICCETGIGSTHSHIALAKNLMRSLGVQSLSSEPRAFVEKSLNFWLSDEFENFTEPMIVGWLLVAETLVPQMFALMLPHVERLGCDTLYFQEHIEVDTDEHSQWMSESVQDVLCLYGAECIEEILLGMKEAWEETIEIPERLYQKNAVQLLPNEKILSGLASEYIDL